MAELLFQDEESLKKRLIPALAKLKDRKPELFHTTVEEQIGKIAGELIVDIFKWLAS